MKILVIDDDSRMRYTLARVLGSGGHEVVTAENGNRGMAAFRRLGPELVITDIFMPEQEGIATIRQIRRERPAAKIMAISGSLGGDRFDVLDIARKLGADDALQKPFDAAELLNRVRLLNVSPAQNGNLAA
jgi:DNA-binding response OmpR family regulator